MPRHPWNDPRPFVLGPADASAGVLLVHGFTGAPPEVRPLGEHLAARGFRVVGVQLTGHGTDEASLDGVTWRDWLADVDEGRRWLDEQCSTVVVAGLSMGGLLSVIHAAERPPAALVLIAPALRISNPLFGLIGAFGWLPGAIRAPSTSGLTSKQGWKRLWHYERRPIRAVRELRRVQAAARRSLGKVLAPTLVIQGAKDQTLDPEGAREVLSELGSESKRLVWLDQSGHIATADVEAEKLFAGVDAFLRDFSVVPT